MSAWGYHSVSLSLRWCGKPSQRERYVGDAVHCFVFEDAVVQLFHGVLHIRCSLIFDKTTQVLAERVLQEGFWNAYPLPLPLPSRSRVTSL